MFCINCGNKLKKGVNFCNKCGEAITLKKIPKIEEIKPIEVEDENLIEALEEVKTIEANESSEETIIVATSTQDEEPEKWKYVPPEEVETSQTKAGSRKWIWFILLPLLLVGTFVGYRYYAFNQLPTVYALTDNIAIRQEAYSQSQEMGRMDMFGSYLDASGSIQQSATQFKKLGESNDYTKVLQNASFLPFLLYQFEEAYVHTKYLTSNHTEYLEYKRIFYSLSTDYNELDKLKFISRKLIYLCINDEEGLVNRAVQATCNQSSTIDNDAPLAIAQIKSKNKLIVIVQLDDGTYHTIVGDENGIYNYETQTSFLNNDFSGNGKFKIYEENTTKPVLWWIDCNENNMGRAAEYPYNNFEYEDYFYGC